MAKENGTATADDLLYFDITPFSLSEVPSNDKLFPAAEKIIAECKNWKKVKTFHKHGSTVDITCRHKGPKDGAGWYARQSVHTKEDGTFDEFWEGLGVGKAVKEKDYIPELKRVVKLKENSPTQSIWSLYYEFPPPVSPRVFAVAQTLREPSVYLTTASGEALREAYIISVPVAIEREEELHAKEEKGVRGRYVSVEHLKETEGGGTEWTMATSSTPGGKIPNFVAERSMPGSISGDVPHFLGWMVNNRKKAAA